MSVFIAMALAALAIVFATVLAFALLHSLYLRIKKQEGEAEDED